MREGGQQEIRTANRHTFARIAGVFALTLTVAWACRAELLVWAVSPSLRALGQATGQPIGIHIARPAEAFLAYVKISLSVAIAASLPLLLGSLGPKLRPLLWSRLVPRQSAFWWLSAAATLAGILYSRTFVSPAVWRGAYSWMQSTHQEAMPSDLPLAEFTELTVGNAASMILGFHVALALFAGLRSRFRERAGGLLSAFLSVSGLSVLASIAAALVTPPDPVSQLTISIPLMLSFVSAAVAAWAARRSVPEPSR